MKRPRERLYTIEEVVENIDTSQPWDCTPSKLHNVAMLCYKYMCDNQPEEVFHKPNTRCKIAHLDIEPWDSGMTRRQRLEGRMCASDGCEDISLHMCYGQRGVCCKHVRLHGIRTCTIGTDKYPYEIRHTSCMCKFPLADPCATNIDYPCLDCEPDTRAYFLSRPFITFQRVFFSSLYRQTPTLDMQHNVLLDGLKVSISGIEHQAFITRTFSIGNDYGILTVTERVTESSSDARVPISWLVGMRIMFGYDVTTNTCAYNKWPKWEQ